MDFGAVAAAAMNICIFWDISPCSLVKGAELIDVISKEA
jgi:hypothetical protein